MNTDAGDAFDTERLFALLDALPDDVAERAREHLRRRAASQHGGGAGEREPAQHVGGENDTEQNEVGQLPEQHAPIAQHVGGEREPQAALYTILERVRIAIPAEVAARCSTADLIQLAAQMMQADALRGMAPTRKPVDNEIGDLLRRPTITLKRSRSRDAGPANA